MKRRLCSGHAHAPQYAFAGTGMDMPLLQWLETYTFPCETKFSDLEHAQKVTGGSEAKRYYAPFLA